VNLVLVLFCARPRLLVLGSGRREQTFPRPDRELPRHDHDSHDFARFHTNSTVAGTHRPPLPKPPPPPKQPLISWGKIPEEPTKPIPKTADLMPKRTTVKDQAIRGTARDAREREDAYSEMRNAALERQGYLDSLGDSLNNVSVSAGSYLASARNTAVSLGLSSWATGAVVE
jgi:hypothetical protein